MGGLVFPAMVVFALAAPLLLIAAGCCELAGLWHRRRGDKSRSPIRLVLAAPLALASAFLLLAYGRTVEILLDLPWLYAVQSNAKPVLEALERYGADRGGPPPDLEALVRTTCRRFRAPGGPPIRVSSSAINEGGEGLYVKCGRMQSFDQFFHAPRHLAVEDIGMTTRIGDWVYYHE
jgi:hypothetical protein